MAYLDRLIALITESRNWSRVKRGRDLAALVAEMLQNTLNVDAGFFVYRRRYLSSGPSDVYAPWGVFSHVSHAMRETANIDLEHVVPTECERRWMTVEEVPEAWKPVMNEDNLYHIGFWPLHSGEQTIGMMVLARSRAHISNDVDIIELCATHFSLLFELIVARRVAEEAARNDPLTGLRNRRGVLEDVAALAESSETCGVPLVVGIMDLNDFKQINDRHGHAAGDKTLQRVADVLSQRVGEAGVACRWGGDEFLFVLPSSESSAAVSEEVQSWFHDVASVSVGCASLGRDGADLETCISVADKRLYERKPVA